MEEIEQELELQPEKQPLIPRSENEKQLIKNRLRRIEGQVRGLEKMVDNDRYCTDILIQVSAVQAALKKVSFTILERHTKTCVADSIKNSSNDELVDELMKVIQQYAK